MKKIASIIILSMFISFISLAQNETMDTSISGNVTIIKDSRLDIIAKTQADAITTVKPKNTVKSTVVKHYGSVAVKGFRIFVIKSIDKDYVMKVRSMLLQKFPTQKPYMSYQAPFIKMKFGDFAEKADAEKCKKIIMAAKIVANNVYVIPDTVTIKIEKPKDGEEENGDDKKTVKPKKNNK